ncbi:cytochrome c oxidase subunit II [Saxibacter everestensis]|uniref:cytochrome-c oxidase n=1 Tax=Saxibacter everestensis TaxID=2909229 RepID=A0ABY8QYC8_9MICO|nr:cytochrome c oxidase subunit II [Brevibacteriaceae bacterium ZFBP1038]
MTAAVLLTSGCSMAQFKRGYLPEESVGATDHTDRIMTLWNGSWAAGLIVGVITWALIIWCVVVYRRRKGETGMPVQLRYNMPIETFYIVVPVLMVMVLFFFTVRDQEAIQKPNDPTVVIEAVGKQWAWDFNYVTDNVYYAGVQTNLDGTEEPGKNSPVLYLPEGERIEMKLRSRDVIHSFWIPAFLQKRDMIPGRESSIYFEPQKEGTYVGKCAELCGEYHSEMLFNVKVVPKSEYDAYIQKLKAEGNVGQLGPEYDRNPGQEEKVGS